MRILVDTNIILDLLQKREPHFSASSQLWKAIERGDMEAFFTASAATDIFYILNKYLGHTAARNALSNILRLLRVASVTETDVKRALNSALNDFEDALQLVCAGKLKADFLVTRNQQDYGQPSNIQICPPDQGPWLLSVK